MIYSVEIEEYNDLLKRGIDKLKSYKNGLIKLGVLFMITSIGLGGFSYFEINNTIQEEAKAVLEAPVETEVVEKIEPIDPTVEVAIEEQTATEDSVVEETKTIEEKEEPVIKKTETEEEAPITELNLSSVGSDNGLMGNIENIKSALNQGFNLYYVIGSIVLFFMSIFSFVGHKKLKQKRMTQYIEEIHPKIISKHKHIFKDHSEEAIKHFREERDKDKLLEILESYHGHMSFILNNYDNLKGEEE